MEIIDIEGDVFYFNDNGFVHKDDGPAIEYLSGEKYWFKGGLIHRDNGPAFIGCRSTVKEYWLFGKKAIGDEIKSIKRNMLFDDIFKDDGV